MKISFTLPEDILYCISLLNQHGKECFVVGGAIRNLLLKKEVHDYDLATNALPNEMIDIFHEFPMIDTGLKHGTLTIIMNHKPIEITTYRHEDHYLDHRHPSHVTFTTSLKEDCSRRDFTINALAYHPTLGLYDYFNGIQDLQNHLICTVGNPDKRFEEDALRILRGLRFACELQFDIEQTSAQAIHQHKEDLRFIAVERICNEFFRIVLSPSPTRILMEYRDVFSIFVPELTANTHYLDSLSSLPQDLAVRLALLFIDAQTTDFYTRLKFSKKLTKQIKQYLTYKQLPLQSKYDIRYAMHVLEDHFHSFVIFRQILEPTINTDMVLVVSTQILSQNDCISFSQLAITGQDLKENGISGKKIKHTLQACLEAVMKDEIENTKKELLAYALVVPNTF